MKTTISVMNFLFYIIISGVSCGIIHTKFISHVASTDDEGAKLILSCLFCLFWPFSIPMVFTILLMKTDFRFFKRKQKVKDIIEHIIENES